MLRNSVGLAVLVLFVSASLCYMSIGARIVITITFLQINRAPNAEASAQRHNEGLKNTNSRIKESHK